MISIFITQGTLRSPNVIRIFKRTDYHRDLYLSQIQNAAREHNLFFITTFDDGSMTVINRLQIPIFKHEIKVLRSIEGLNQKILDQLEQIADALDPNAIPYQYIVFEGD